MTASYTVAVRRSGIDGLHAAAIAAIISLIFYLPVYLVFFEDGLFSKPMADLLFQALYQGILVAAISLALYGRAIRLLGASKAAAFVALGPTMTALMGIPVLGEWPSSLAWAAIAVVTAGVYLASDGPLLILRLRPIGVRIAPRPAPGGSDFRARAGIQLISEQRGDRPS